MIYPLSNGHVLGGGAYDTVGWPFSSNLEGGEHAGFLVEFAPETQTALPVIDKGNNDINIYPNPASHEVTVYAKNGRSVSVVILDVTGRKVYESGLSEKVCIGVKDWQKGIYFVEVTDDFGVRSLVKLLVE